LKHSFNCAIYRSGDIRAWCDCGVDMPLVFKDRWERDHRRYNTEDGWFCEAGDDCPVCAAEDEEGEEDEDEE